MRDSIDILSSLSAWQSPTMIAIIVGVAAPLYAAASQLNKRTTDALEKVDIVPDVLAKGIPAELRVRIDAHERHASTLFVVNAIMGASSLLSGLGVALGKLSATTLELKWLIVAILLLSLGVASVIYAERFRRRVKRSVRELESDIRQLAKRSAETKGISQALQDLLQSQEVPTLQAP